MKLLEEQVLGIIGGTGLYSFKGFDSIEEVVVDTPFGFPSAPLIKGKVGSCDVVFLPRHGKEHQYLPHLVNYQANIFALKTLGVNKIISVSAVGSLQEKIKPGDLALPSQYFDFVKGNRQRTFFENGVAVHVSTAEPTCPVLAQIIIDVADEQSIELHTKKTYGCVDGPRLGTRAESFFLKNAAGCDLVGMTNVPEVFLAREAQISYCTIAVVTDYDCWRDDPSDFVNVEQVIAKYQESLGKVKQLLSAILSKSMSSVESSPARSSLKNAILTPLDSLDDDSKILFDVLKR